jgi:hypothetical protein
MGKATKWGLLFLILLFPSLLYIGLSTGRHNLFSLPYYGEYHLNAEGDTIPEPLALVDDIKPHLKKLEALDTSIFIVAFVDIKNQELSSRVGTQLSSIAEKLSPMRDFRILVVSDSRLTEEKKLFQAFDKSQDKWHFLNVNGDLSNFYTKYFAWDQSSKSPFQRAYLVDKQSFIRGVYNAEEYSKVKELSDDIKALKADELTPKKNQDERTSSE